MEHSCSYSHTDISTSSLEEPWDCPHDVVDDHERCVFHLSATERDEIGISDGDVHRRFEAALESGDPDRRAFVGAIFPGLDFDHADVEHADQRSIDLRHASIDGDFLASYSKFEEALDLRDTILGAFRADNADFNDGLSCQRATFEGPVDCSEGIFTGDDVNFTGATFEATVKFDEATFADDATFDDATFSDEATFLGTEFHGRASEIDDNTSFVGAVFGALVRFDHAQFEATRFETTQFTAGASFEGVRATGAVTFDRSTFEAEAGFNGTKFEDDVSFAEAVFGGETLFRGVEFEGGATILRDDADFSGVHFGHEVSFEGGNVGSSTFDEATFEADACFSHVDFRADTSFDAARFAGDADFDEATFDGDASFEGVTFSALANYRGVEFRGSSNSHSASVTFETVTFEGDANFHNVTCTTATFWEVRFAGDVRFTKSAFTDRIDLKIVSIESDTVANFTDAFLAKGEFVQPEYGWIRYDLTEATVGDITFRVDGTDDRDLFEYVRFCDTQFTGFDFAAHVQYFTRSNWKLHEFEDDGLEYEYAVEMTPLAIEKTYQRAKISASTEGNVEASGKFRFKRQQYARKNYLDIARDPTESLSTRVQNGLRVGENLFLGITCGHGMRLYRITAMFVFFPILPALMYAFGGSTFQTQAGQLDSVGDLATMGGAETFFNIIYFSYITYLTIGYGDIIAVGWMAHVMVGFEAYVSVILGGLFIYVLVRRSEL